MISRRLLSASLVAGVLALTVPAFVVPVNAKAKKTTAKTGEKPAGATGECNDGTYTKAKTQQGACSKHGGVKTWYGEAAMAPEPAPAKTTTTKRAPKPAKAAPAPEPAPANTTTAPAAPAKTAPAAGTPANATAKCKDGTFSYAKQHSGACSHHGGVAEWYK
jgi:uncharacterized protein with FMN-binding domain